jgi:hypothetical protein
MRRGLEIPKELGIVDIGISYSHQYIIASSEIVPGSESE